MRVGISESARVAALRAAGSDRVRGVAALLLLVAAVLLVVAPDLLAGRAMANFADNAATYHPLRLEAGRQWAEGRVPLWNPYKRAGAPLLGDAIAAALYPPTLAFAFADGGGERVMDAIAALHHVLAACFAYFLFRTFQLRRSAAVLGAIAYALNGFAVYTASLWLGIQSAITWAPLLIACLERAVRAGLRSGWTFLGAVAYALQILAGFPEIAVYTAFLAGGFAVLRALGTPRARLRPLVAVTLIGVGGVLLAAPQVLPALVAARDDIRPAVLPVRMFAAGGLLPDGLLGLVTPGVRVRTDLAFMTGGSVYVGIAALCFAAAAPRRRDALFAYAALVTLYGVILTLGASSPLGPVGHYVPGLSSFRSPWKHVYEICFGLALLTALGADRFLRGARGDNAAVALAALLLGGVVLLRWRAEAAPLAPLFAHAPLALGAPLGVAALAALGRRRVAVGVAVLGLVLTLAQSRAELLDLARRAKPPPADLPPELRPGKDEFWRVLALRSALQSAGPLLGDRPTRRRLYAVHGDGPFLWRPLADALRINEAGMLERLRAFDRDDQTLDVLAVRYVIAPRQRDGSFLNEPALRAIPGARVEEHGDRLLVERPNPHPFAHVPERAVCAVDPASLIHLDLYDLRRSALIECPPEQQGSRSAASGGTVRASRLEPGLVELDVEVTGPARALVVVSQADQPGWHAAVDGEPAPILRTNGLVQGVFVPPGVHAVRLAYAPASFPVGAGVALVALAGFAAWTWAGRAGLGRRGRRFWIRE